jgi:hypothetical protein
MDAYRERFNSVRRPNSEAAIMKVRSTATWPVILLLPAISLMFHAQVRAAEPPVGFFPSKTLPTGVYDFDKTVIIPRQRAMPRERDKTAGGVPAPYLATQPSFPGGWLRGEDRFGTVLRFSPSIKGCLIKTEGFGDGHVGGSWNENNTKGDKTLRSNLCSSASDFTVDGCSELRDRNAEPRADGLCVEGNGFSAHNLRFFRIPGTALVVKGVAPAAFSEAGIYDNQQTEIRDIHIAGAINGVDVSAGDAKLSHIYVVAVIKDGLILRSSGAFVEGDHIWGADRAAVFQATAMASNCYHEAARIGTHILASADRTRIDSLNIGPATCWERGVKIEASGATVVGIVGAVQAESEKHPDIAGVEITSGASNVTIEGSLSVEGDESGNSTAKVVVLSGRAHKIDLRGGWSVPTKATYVRLAGGTTASTIQIRGHGEGGVALDLSASKLNEINGLGNEFKVWWNGSAARVIYPGGGSTYNLAPGTQLWIDGVLQSANSPKTPIK